MSRQPDGKRIKMSHTGLDESKSSDDEDDDIVTVIPEYRDQNGNINSCRHVNLPLDQSLSRHVLSQHVSEIDSDRHSYRNQASQANLGDLDDPGDPSDLGASDSTSASSSSGSSISDEITFELSDTSSDSSDNPIDFFREFDHDIDYTPPEEYLKYDPTPTSPYPRPDWAIVNELNRRRCGLSISSRPLGGKSPSHFERHASYSLWMLQRLERSKELEEHTGCVNDVHFNSSGSLLASGGDDLSVCIWDWQANKCLTRLTTGHQSNIYHCQFCDSDQSIITCARDGSVRRCNIERNITETLFSQNSEVAKLRFLSPKTLVTCGYSGEVHMIDLRVKNPTSLYTVRHPASGRRVMLNTIDSHPFETHTIVTAGMSPYIFVHDLRRPQGNPTDPDHKQPICYLDNPRNMRTFVTSTAFNSTGDKILASYNDDDLYVYSSSTCEVLKRYEGHRNRDTLKGCCWFGDNFVLSGSDDGHIFGWEYGSRHIVCFLDGDEQGIVNTLVVHPSLPVLASSGLDHSVKIWEPISQTWPRTLKGIKPVICRNIMRRLRSRR